MGIYDNDGRNDPNPGSEPSDIPGKSDKATPQSPQEIYKDRIDFVLRMTEQQIGLSHNRSLNTRDWDDQHECGELFARLTDQFLDMIDR